MKKFLNKAKEHFDSPSSSSSQQQAPLTSTSHPPQPSTIQPPTAQDILRYRYHHGVNLGSVFVLEKWLFPRMYPDSAANGTELAAVSASIKEVGLDKTREKWESHWNGAVTDAAWGWFVNDAKGTSIRLPVGFYTLGPEFCAGTEWEAVSGVYQNAWEHVRRFVEKARSFGVGVLIDLHVLPGGANGDAHGSASGKAELWGSKKHCSRAKDAVLKVVGDCKAWDGVIGVQLCNEACWGAGKKGMWSWYEDVLASTAEIDSSMPIYVSDAWELKGALEWCKKRTGGNPIVVDTHKYYTFGEEDRASSPQQILAKIPHALSDVHELGGDVSSRGAIQVVVGEWSCVLDGKTWSRVSEGEKAGLVQQFGRAQSQQWAERAGGSFFWTWKMQWMEGGEWGFVEQTKKGNVVAPPNLSIPPQDVQSRVHNAMGQKDQMAQQARQSHEGHWNNTSPGKQFQHDWYSEGWDTGFADAAKFFTARSEGVLGQKSKAGGDKIGCLEIWVQKRLWESGKRGEFVWEFEQGLRAGIGAFYHTVGV